MTPQLAPHRVNIQTCIQNVSLSLTTRHLPADASSVGRTSSSVCLRREQQRETSNDLAHLAYIPQAHSRDMCMQPPAPSARSTQHTRRFQKAHDHALTRRVGLSAGCGEPVAKMYCPAFLTVFVCNFRKSPVFVCNFMPQQPTQWTKEIKHHNRNAQTLPVPTCQVLVLICSPLTCRVQQCRQLRFT